MDGVAQEHHLSSDGYREAAMPPARGISPKVQQVQGAAGGKRAAAEPLEQSISKAAKLTTNNDDETFSETEVKDEPDEKDEKISVLLKALEDEKAKVAELEDELEQSEDEKADYRARVQVLEARNEQARERDRVVETSMTAAMKQASRKLDALQKAEHQQKLKDMKQSFKEEKEELVAQHKTKLKKVEDIASARVQKERKDAQLKHRNTVADHKEEIKNLKEQHKAELKGFRPDHSKAMKEKASELKAKDAEITNLKKSLQSMNALEAEKEKLADKLDRERERNEGFSATIETFKKAHAGLEGQYHHDMDQASQKWQIQNNIAEDAKAKLMFQQRSNFALRAEATHRVQRIQSLEQQLQAAQAQRRTSTANASVQTSIGADDTNGSENNVQDSQVREIDNSSPAVESSIDQTMGESVELEAGAERTE